MKSVLFVLTLCLGFVACTSKPVSEGRAPSSDLSQTFTNEQIKAVGEFLLSQDKIDCGREHRACASAIFVNFTPRGYGTFYPLTSTTLLYTPHEIAVANDPSRRRSYQPAALVETKDLQTARSFSSSEADGIERFVSLMKRSENCDWDFRIDSNGRVLSSAPVNCTETRSQRQMTLAKELYAKYVASDKSGGGFYTPFATRSGEKTYKGFFYYHSPSGATATKKSCQMTLRYGSIDDATGTVGGIEITSIGGGRLERAANWVEMGSEKSFHGPEVERDENPETAYFFQGPNTQLGLARFKFSSVNHEPISARFDRASSFGPDLCVFQPNLL